MATQADVRRIALALPGVEEGKGRFAFSVLNKGKQKGFVWDWMERITPKKPKVANAGVIAARVANVAQRDLMIAADPVKFFTEPHYAGFPAVLVHLDQIKVADLRIVVAEAWRCLAPPELVGAGAKASRVRRARSSDKTNMATAAAKPAKAAKTTAGTKATKAVKTAKATGVLKSVRRAESVLPKR